MTICKTKKGYSIRVDENELACILTLAHIFRWSKKNFFEILERTQVYNKYLEIIRKEFE